MNNFFISITLFLIFSSSIFYSMEYYQHRNSGLQIYSDVLTSAKYEKLEKETKNIDLKNKYHLLSFTHSIESMSPKKLINFITLLDDEYLKKKTIHHFTDRAIAKVFLEKKYPHLHLGTNKQGLSNVFTDQKRIEDFTYYLTLLQAEPANYVKLVEELCKLQEKNNNPHARVNFAIALSLAHEDIRKKFDKKRKSHF